MNRWHAHPARPSALSVAARACGYVIAAAIAVVAIWILAVGIIVSGPAA